MGVCVIYEVIIRETLQIRKLDCSDRIIIKDYMETKDNLMGFLTSYVAEHPEVDINTIISNENNIKRVLEAL